MASKTQAAAHAATSITFEVVPIPTRLRGREAAPNPWVDLMPQLLALEEGLAASIPLTGDDADEKGIARNKRLLRAAARTHGKSAQVAVKPMELGVKFEIWLTDYTPRQNKPKEG